MFSLKQCPAKKTCCCEWLRLASVSLADAALPVLAFVVTLVTATLATAQDRSIPGSRYFIAIETLYDGDYRQAERMFNSELRGGIKTVSSRWIDSICYHTMRGETYYQQGRNADALVEFDRACQLYLTYPKWMQSVKFQQPPRPDTNRGRQLAPWGRSARQVTNGILPETMLMAQGRIDNTQQYDRGGVVQSAQFWKVNVVEIVRTTALAIRRRSEILGPLSKHDRLSRDLSDTLSRGGLGQPNHWSNAWNELLTGLALLGTDKPKQALGRLNRAILLDGRYDHALTGVALLAQAEAARLAGNLPAAEGLLREASYAAFVYEDLDIMTEALVRGHAIHLIAGGEGLYGPLESAAAWADRSNLNHFATTCRLGMAESLVEAGRTKNALSLLKSRSLTRDIVAGRLGPRSEWLRARALLQSRQADDATKVLAGAIKRQIEVSPAVFRMQVANARYDSGDISARLAVDVFRTLLEDPTPPAWTADPLDGLAHLKTDHEASFDRWLAAAIGRREVELAIEVTDLAKRRRFFRAQPLGGRLLALRHLVNSREDGLTQVEKLQRQAILQGFPTISEASNAADAARGQLADAPALFEEGRPANGVARTFDQLGKALAAEEQLLQQIALGRQVASFSFPPLRETKQVQALLRPGQAIMAFHEAAGTLHGFLIVQKDTHHWQLPNSKATQGQLAKLLQAMGNFSSSATLTTEQAKSEEWRTLAASTGTALLADSRLDLSQTKQLIVIPDGPLWHAPFEALIVKTSDKPLLMIDTTPVRYAPTVGLSVGDTRPQRPAKRTGIAVPKPSNASRDEGEQALQERLAAAVHGPVWLRPPLPASAPLVATAVDQLVVTLESEISPNNPYAWAPAPLERGDGASLSSWLMLSDAGPQRLLLGGVHTIAENGLKAGRRARRGEVGEPVGREMFHAACGLMASGARTTLMSRWTTGGANHVELMREFAAEAPRTNAAEAWRRSLSLARDTRLDPTQEPRLKWNPDEDPPQAQHPFFWAGYLLLDTGFDPSPPSEDEAAEGEAKENLAPKAAAELPAPAAEPAAN